MPLAVAKAVVTSTGSFPDAHLYLPDMMSNLISLSNCITTFLLLFLC